MSLITTPLIILLLFFITISTVFIVKQQSAAIIERFGKFQSVRKPGFQVKIPLVDRIAGRLSLKVLQLDVVVETKTSDDVFVKLKVSVQYRVVESKVFDAFYKLDFPQDQITSYVFDLIRSQVPKMKLDDVFSKQDDIAVAVKQSLGDAMEEYGYFIVKALVTDIEPDAELKIAMNIFTAADR
jgi:regulator of protease activity HflC (stomatin/prohibitin superfamily)